VDVVVGGVLGGAAAWYALSILVAGKYQYRRRGHTYVFTPNYEPFWYWLWVGIWASIALFFLFLAFRGLWQIIQVCWMDKRIVERERLSGAQEWSNLKSPTVTFEKSVTIKTIGPDGEEHEYHSMDEVPPELRSEIEALSKEAGSDKGATSSVTKVSKADNTITSHTVRTRKANVYKIVDESGVERIYDSLDKMPPEIRAAIEDAEKKLK